VAWLQTRSHSRPFDERDVVIRYTYGDVTVSIPDPIGSPAASPSTAYSGVSTILTARSGMAKILLLYPL
jgi:hypothetical protein